MMILEDVFINLFVTLDEKDEAKKVNYAPFPVTLTRNTAKLSDDETGVTVVSWTKATVGGVPPFSRVCLSYLHEWLCTPRMKMV